MRKISILPSVITLGNITCGFASVVLAADGEYERAAWLILLGMVFDALDGQVARMTRTAGNFGVQLDSLCDIVTFGLAPAVLINRIGLDYGRLGIHDQVVWLLPMLYLVCAALRLARFNLETGTEEEDHECFCGLPSPAAAGLVATLIILNNYLPARPFDFLPERPVVVAMPFVGLVAGALMVSRVKYAHFGNRLFRGARPFTWLMALIFLCILMALSIKVALATIFTVYTLGGVVQGLWAKLFGKPPAAIAQNTPNE
ncbi:MAG: CDP-diacylglycerol--serine O-phosphatidyltransferase [Planctomycetes bacterium]|nr:CDP-diacylglycerol--serine O-phosphatidyltransferase [Planctomycetota bacterium]